MRTVRSHVVSLKLSILTCFNIPGISTPWENGCKRDSVIFSTSTHTHTLRHTVKLIKNSGSPILHVSYAKLECILHQTVNIKLEKKQLRYRGWLAPGAVTMVVRARTLNKLCTHEIEWILLHYASTIIVHGWTKVSAQNFLIHWTAFDGPI